MAHASTLSAIREVFRPGTWPPKAQQDIWEEIELYAALRASDTVRIRQERSKAWNRDYLISPVPRLISRASANLLFGETPVFLPVAEEDINRLEHISEENMLPSELHRAAMIASSEGEVWGKVATVPDLLDFPVIEFVSRRRVIPHFYGRFVVGATFITEWEEGTNEILRLLETYLKGRIESRLFRGTRTQLGQRISLDSYEKTRGRQESVVTGVDAPLVAYIPNSVDDNPTRGFSDYKGLEDRFYALNEAPTIGQHNQRLAGRKRAIVDAGYVDSRGRLPEGDDLFIRTSREVGDLAEKPAPVQVIDYDYEADQTIKWIDHLIDSTLSLGGIAPQSIGRNVEGYAQSGTAVKLRMNHSLMEAAGKGRHFDRGIQTLLVAAMQLDSRIFGRTWTNPNEKPSVERGDGLPRDETEIARQLVDMVSAEAISLEERVRFLHPQWTDKQVLQEVNRIRAEEPRVEEPFRTDDDLNDPADGETTP